MSVTPKKVILSLGIVIGLGVVGHFLKPVEEKGPSSAAPQSSVRQLDPPLLPAVETFLSTHREFGQATATTAMPDWASGSRQRVQFESGTNLLFYTKGAAVVTVYADTDGGRKIVWGQTE